MVRTNDTLMALVPLLEDPPWVRRRKNQTEKRIGNVWTAVAPRDRLRLTQQDAQVMLGLIAHAVGNLARPTYCCSSAYVARSPAVQMGTVQCGVVTGMMMTTATKSWCHCMLNGTA